MGILNFGRLWPLHATVRANGYCSYLTNKNLKTVAVADDCGKVERVPESNIHNYSRAVPVLENPDLQK